jgi:deoxyribodipyrimidine photo-lyase
MKSRARPILGMPQDTIDIAVVGALERAKMDPAHDTNETVRGGERWALKRLDSFLRCGHAVTARRDQADVSNNNSSRLASSLAMGTLSPRVVHERVQDALRTGGDGCQWLASHLEIRDFFISVAFASGPRLFCRERFRVPSKKMPPVVWKDFAGEDATTAGQWERWASGNTGLPLVDAAMSELLHTGCCSNRVRQNVASVLAKDLKIDWRAGAEWFQFLLADHCVAANWGNWRYFAGVGSDPKNRHFCTVSQALKYDPDGTYVKQWVPRLATASLDSEFDIEGLFRPWDFIEVWPTIVDPETQLTWHDVQKLKQTGKLCCDVE